MNERDELAKVIAAADGSGHFLRNGRRYAYGPVADAILAAGYRRPRQVTTVEELDALIAESVVRSDAGIIYERYADEDGPEFDYWLIPGEPRAQASTKIDLPALVIFDPEPQS